MFKLLLPAILNSNDIPSVRNVGASAWGILSFDFFLEESIWNRNQFFGKEITDLGYVSEEIQLNELDSYRNKKFICFNRTIDKEHRDSLLNEYLSGNYSDSYFTFLLKTENYAKRYGEYMNNKGIKAEYFNKHIQFFKRFK